MAVRTEKWKYIRTYDIKDRSRIAFEELYDLENDPFEIRNLAFDDEYRDVLTSHRRLLTQWIDETDDRGRYPEDSANLKYMLDVWRERGVEPVNPEYDHLRG